MMRILWFSVWLGVIAASAPLAAVGEEAQGTPTYRRIRSPLDGISVVDTHDHLRPFDRLPGPMETDRGRGMTLHGLWRTGYFPQIHPPDNALALFPQPKGRLQDGTEGPPEYGRGVSPREAEAGWIALFDGATEFGWSGAKAADALLAGGETSIEFGPFELRAVVERAGTITVGGVDYLLAPGPWTLPESKGQGPIRLSPGAAVRELAIRPLGLSTIFNGEALEGWDRVDHPRIAPAKRPTWEVADGMLRARGGPGALEYRGGRFGDLVLQVVARTRAPHANAGVFFRCRPGELMEGYEAQVYNVCEGGDPARPARYATGAIDDRQNARRLVSRDARPFTMTVVAQGPHLATWINGYQVTDWADTRSTDENPRQGLRTQPGTIQLQAHDRETDVEFRSIRVGGLRDTGPADR